jgi:hypothetical protein
MNHRDTEDTEGSQKNTKRFFFDASIKEKDFLGVFSVSSVPPW